MHLMVISATACSKNRYPAMDDPETSINQKLRDQSHFTIPSTSSTWYQF